MIQTTITGSLPRIGEDLTPLMKTVGELMLASVRKNFGQGGRPTRWKPLVTGGESFLFGTGSLLQSVEMTSGADFAEVGTPSKIGLWMHEGGHNPLVTQKSKAFFWAKFYQTGEGFWRALALKKIGTRINMPARPFMLFQDEDIETIKSFFGRELVKFITADQEAI